MIFISILSGLSLFILFYLIFYYYKIKINTGYLLAFFLFFDIYGLILSKIFPFITPFVFILIISIFILLISFTTNPSRFIEALKNKIVLLWIIFSFYILLSFFWTPNQNYGFFKFQIYIIKGILPGLAIYFSYIIYKKITWEPAIFSGLLYILVFFFLKQDSAYFSHRMTIEGSNPIWISRASLLYVTIIIITTKKSYLAKAILAIPGIIAAALTQSKGPFIGLFIGFAGYYLYLYKKRNKDISIGLLLTKIVFTIIIIFIVINFLIEYIDFFKTSRFAVLFNFKKLFSQITFLDRIVRYNKAIHIFLKNFIIGSGIGGFADADIRSYPHNILLEILSELGILGTALWSAIIYKIYKLSKQNALTLILFLQTITYAMFSGDMQSNTEYVLISFLTMALNYNIHHNYVKETTSN